MADASEGFNAEAIASFIVSRGGKISTGELARKFRKYLLDEDKQGRPHFLIRLIDKRSVIVNHSLEEARFRFPVV